MNTQVYHFSFKSGLLLSVHTDVINPPLTRLPQKTCHCKETGGCVNKLPPPASALHAHRGSCLLSYQAIQRLYNNVTKIYKALLQ